MSRVLVVAVDNTNVGFISTRDSLVTDGHTVDFCANTSTAMNAVVLANYDVVYAQQMDYGSATTTAPILTSWSDGGKPVIVGMVELNLPAGAVTTSHPALMNLAASTGQGVGLGEIHVTFTTAALTHDATRNITTAADNRATQYNGGNSEFCGHANSPIGTTLGTVNTANVEVPSIQAIPTGTARLNAAAVTAAPIALFGYSWVHNDTSSRLTAVGGAALCGLVRWATGQVPSTAAKKKIAVVTNDTTNAAPITTKWALEALDYAVTLYADSDTSLAAIVPTDFSAIVLERVDISDARIAAIANAADGWQAGGTPLVTSFVDINGPVAPPHSGISTRLGLCTSEYFANGVAANITSVNTPNPAFAEAASAVFEVAGGTDYTGGASGLIGSIVATQNIGGTVYNSTSLIEVGTARLASLAPTTTRIAAVGFMYWMVGAPTLRGAQILRNSIEWAIPAPGSKAVSASLSGSGTVSATDRAAITPSWLPSSARTSGAAAVAAVAPLGATPHTSGSANLWIKAPSVAQSAAASLGGGSTLTVAASVVHPTAWLPSLGVSSGRASVPAIGQMAATARTSGPATLWVKSATAGGSGVAATLTGAGTLTGNIALASATTAVTYGASAALTGATSVTARIGVTTSASAVLTGVGTATTTLAQVDHIATTLTGLTSMAAAATRVTSAASGFVASGALTAVITNSTRAAASLTGSSSITANATRVPNDGAGLVGTGTLQANAHVSHSIASALSGASALASTVRLTHPATAPLNGSGQLTANLQLHVAAALQGTSTLGASATRSTAARATLSGTATLTGNAVEHPMVRAALAGTGALAATTHLTHSASAALAATSALTLRQPLPAAAALRGSGQLSGRLLGAGFNAQLTGKGTFAPTITVPKRVLLITSDTTSTAYTNTQAALVAASHTVTGVLDTATALGAVTIANFDVVVTVGLTMASHASTASQLNTWEAAGVPMVLSYMPAGATDTTTLPGDLVVASDMGLMSSASVRTSGDVTLTTTRQHPVTDVLGAGSPFTMLTGTNSIALANDPIGDVLGTAVINLNQQPVLNAIERGVNRLGGLPETSTRIVMWGQLFAGQTAYTDQGRRLLNAAVDWVTAPRGFGASLRGAGLIQTRVIVGPRTAIYGFGHLTATLSDPGGYLDNPIDLLPGTTSYSGRPTILSVGISPNYGKRWFRWSPERYKNGRVAQFVLTIQQSKFISIYSAKTPTPTTADLTYVGGTDHDQYVYDYMAPISSEFTINSSLYYFIVVSAATPQDANGNDLNIDMVLGYTDPGGSYPLSTGVSMPSARQVTVADSSFVRLVGEGIRGATVTIHADTTPDSPALATTVVDSAANWAAPPFFHVPGRYTLYVRQSVVQGEGVSAFLEPSGFSPLPITIPPLDGDTGTIGFVGRGALTAVVTNSSTRVAAAPLVGSGSFTASVTRTPSAGAGLASRSTLGATIHVGTTAAAGLSGLGVLSTETGLIPAVQTTVQVLERIGASPGNDLATTRVYLLGEDLFSSQATAQQSPLRPRADGAPSSSVERWVRFAFTAQVASIADLYFWMPNLVIPTGWTLKFGMTDTYATPSNSLSSVATQVVPTAKPVTPNMGGRPALLGPAPVYSSWLVLQATVTGDAAPGPMLGFDSTGHPNPLSFCLDWTQS